MNQFVPSVLGLAALVVATLAFLRMHEAERFALAPAAMAAREDNEELVARIEALEARAASVPASPAVIERVDVPPGSLPEFGVVFAELQRRVAELERKAGAPSAEHVGRVQPDEVDSVVAAAARVERTAAAQSAILDPRADVQKKMQAWRELRGAGPDAWNDRVVHEMVHIGLSSPDPAIRADVWRQADAGARHAALVPAMLQALVSDAEPKVREEAAETLAEYRDHAGVAAALEAAAAGDADNGVRRQARNSLR